MRENLEEIGNSEAGNFRQTSHEHAMWNYHLFGLERGNESSIVHQRDGRTRILSLEPSLRARALKPLFRDFVVKSGEKPLFIMKLREGKTWQKESATRSDARYWFGAAAVGRQ